jgi:hypothetical protein
MKDRGGWHVFCTCNDAASGNLGGYFADTNTDDDASNKEEDDKDGESEEDQSATSATAAAAVVVAVLEWRQSPPTDSYLLTVPLLLQMDQVMITVLHHLLSQLAFDCMTVSPGAFMRSWRDWNNPFTGTRPLCCTRCSSV